MHWEIETKDKKITLTPYELINILVGKVVEKERDDHEYLANAFTEYLETRQVLSNVNPKQLITMAMEFGYMYKVFL